VTENEAKVALIWILGELGESLDDAPYILENYVNGLSDDKNNNEIKNSLLNSSVRLFLKRPPEM
jgi:AP-4 complex subunit beta-1